MSWEMAVVGALGVAQYQQQGAMGKYNQAVQNRNAVVAEQEAQQLDKKLEFDIAQFDKKVVKLEGETETNLAKSGVETGTGTSARINIANLTEAEIQRKLLRYNTDVAKAGKLEEANFARIQGQLYKQEARLAQIQTVAKTGTSLLSMSGGFGGSSPYGSASSGSFQTSQGRIIGGV